MENLELISLIGNTGFPIAITAYLLIRLEKQLTSLATVKSLRATTLSIEVQNGIDKEGSPVYKKKSFSSVKGNATPEAIANVAEAIKLVLANRTRQTLVNEISVLEDNA